MNLFTVQGKSTPCKVIILQELTIEKLVLAATNDLSSLILQHVCGLVSAVSMLAGRKKLFAKLPES